MPYARRRPKAKPRTMRRKRYTRKAMVPRAPMDVHYFKRYATDKTITGNAVHNPYLDVAVFEFQQIINPTEFTVLFDHYMITKTVTKFWLRQDPGAQTATGSTYPKLYWARDTDDSTVAASLNELRQHNTMKVRALDPNKPITIVTRPNLLGLSYSTALLTNYTPVWNKWVDCNDTATRHFGFKYAIDNLTNTNYSVNIETVYYFKCKHTR